MTPKAAYDQISARARDFQRLHDGLINLRSYRIRKDWKAGLCRLMRWSQDIDIERVDTKDALIILREGSDLRPSDFSSRSLDDLLRASLSLAVSALDRYVHERIVRSVIATLKRRDLSRRQQGLSIPAVFALQAAEAVRRAAREGKQARPANEIRKRIQDQLHRQSFQNWKEIEEAFELVGVTGLAGKLQARYRVANFTEIRDRLNSIVDRRHKIVHEGDLVRHARGGRPRPSPISRKFVDESLIFLDGFVEKLETVD
jgi:hypothetical protein